MGKSPFLMGKSSINGQFSIAMLVYQRVTNDDKIAGSFKSLLSFIFGRMIPYDKPIFQGLFSTSFWGSM